MQPDALQQENHMSQSISRGDLKNLMDSGKKLTLVEALPHQYFEAEHLPDAINIPHDEIPVKAVELIPDKSSAIVVYCASDECQNSHIAAETLRQLGYTSVYEYAGGKKDWKEAGLPFENNGGAQ
jgi:rhodanese-related sulfurtransferase